MIRSHNQSRDLGPGREVVNAFGVAGSTGVVLGSRRNHERRRDWRVVTPPGEDGERHHSLENIAPLVAGGTPHRAPAAEGITRDANFVTIHLDSVSSSSSSFSSSASFSFFFSSSSSSSTATRRRLAARL